jgi:hypothetical protein
LTKFENDLLQHTIPGVAVFIGALFKSYSSSLPDGDSFVLGQFLNYVCYGLGIKLCKRKIELTEYKAMLGHIALLLPESYAESAPFLPLLEFDLPDDDLMNEIIASFEGEDDPPNLKLLATLGNMEFVINFDLVAGSAAIDYRVNNPWRQERFIGSHLFYLHNPVDSYASEFLTFPPVQSKRNVRLYKGFKFVDWDLPSSEFDPLEFFTIAASLFIPWSSSVACLLLNANAFLQNLGGPLTQSMNLQAAALNGNSFEVTAAVCAVRASHYC